MSEIKKYVDGRYKDNRRYVEVLHKHLREEMKHLQKKMDSDMLEECPFNITKFHVEKMQEILMKMHESLERMQVLVESRRILDGE